MSRQATFWVLLISLSICLGAAIYGYVHERGRPVYWRQAHEAAAARAFKLEEEVEALEANIASLQRDITRWEERFDACKELLAAASERMASSHEDAPTDTSPPLPEDEDASEPHEAQGSVGSPLAFEILGEELHDSPLKAQVVLQVLLRGDPTADSLRGLLVDLYSYAMGKRGFQYHEQPTNVYIYLFTSVEHAEDATLWVAMLDKSYGDLQPNITVDEERLDLYTNPGEPEERLGLTESERRRVFADLIRAQDRARDESMARYPYLNLLSPSYSQAAALAQIERQTGEYRRLEAIYRTALAERHGLTLEELSAIVSEGISKQWPMPPLGQ